MFQKDPAIAWAGLVVLCGIVMLLCKGITPKKITAQYKVMTKNQQMAFGALLCVFGVLMVALFIVLYGAGSGAMWSV